MRGCVQVCKHVRVHTGTAPHRSGHTAPLPDTPLPALADKAEPQDPLCSREPCLPKDHPKVAPTGTAVARASPRPRIRPTAP